MKTKYIHISHYQSVSQNLLIFQQSVSLMFLPHFDVFCDLLLNRCTATWNLSVLQYITKKQKQMGKGKECDLTDASADTSPTRWSRHHQHITETLPTRWSANCRCVGRHTTDASADTLPTRWSKYFPFLTIILLSLSVGSKNNFIRKDENVIAK